MIRERYTKILQAYSNIINYERDIEEYIGKLVKMEVNGAEELIIKNKGHASKLEEPKVYSGKEPDDTKVTLKKGDTHT